MALPRSEWERIKALRVVPRWLHISKTPEQCLARPKERRVFFGSRISAKGTTLNLGRNKSKRENRREDIKARKQRRKAA